MCVSRTLTQTLSSCRRWRDASSLRPSSSSGESPWPFCSSPPTCPDRRRRLSGLESRNSNLKTVGSIPWRGRAEWATRFSVPQSQLLCRLICACPSPSCVRHTHKVVNWLALNLWSSPLCSVLIDVQFLPWRDSQTLCQDLGERHCLHSLQSQTTLAPVLSRLPMSSTHLCKQRHWRTKRDYHHRSNCDGFFCLYDQCDICLFLERFAWCCFLAHWSGVFLVCSNQFADFERQSAFIAEVLAPVKQLWVSPQFTEWV